MSYYIVGVASQIFYGYDPLTYSGPQGLEIGQVVEVEIKNKLAIGVVLSKTSKPDFKTKPIIAVLEKTVLPKSSLALIDWLKGYYPASFGLIVGQFLPNGLAKKSRSTVSEDKNQKPSKTKLPPLTSEQTAVLRTIRTTKDRTFLLHGETGSGKTRIYTELTEEVTQNGQSAIILTPEISLTPQLVKSFEDQFGNQVILTHSNLTPVERKKLWLKVISSTEPFIVIGPRSALFMPLKNIGLIVVDEFHEPAYKQDRQPKYQANRVASALSAIHNSKLIFGSATPLIADYYLAQQKKAPLLRMKQKATKVAGAGVDIGIVDLREKSELSSQAFISKTLLKTAEAALANKEQVILFLNRRGSARLVFCKACGWQALCPNCNLPLTYHQNQHIFRCHLCNFTQPALTSCPKCHSSDINFSNIGTQGLAASVKKLLPQAKVQRFDSDNTKDEQLPANFSKVVSGELEVLVGTQILAKGLDLPHLSVVGLVMADSSLQFPDYTAAERTYQLVTQLVGRVGRGHRHGHAVIQTYNPENPVLDYALKNDWDGFYEAQLIERKLYGYPPFFHLLKLEIKRASPSSAQTASHKLVSQLKNLGLKIQLVGPSPSFIEKQSGAYCWQIIVKAKDRSQLSALIKHLPSGWSYDLDPNHLL